MLYEISPYYSRCDLELRLLDLKSCDHFKDNGCQGPAIYKRDKSYLEKGYKPYFMMRARIVSTTSTKSSAGESFTPLAMARPSSRTLEVFFTGSKRINLQAVAQLDFISNVNLKGKIKCLRPIRCRLI